MAKTYTQKRWSLAALHPAADSPEMKADFEEIERQTAAFEKMRPLLTDKISQTEFMSMIRALESIYRITPGGAHRTNGSGHQQPDAILQPLVEGTR